MEYNEKDVEDLLMSDGWIGNICLMERQVKTAYGIIDILGYDEKTNMLVVVEIKKGTVDENAVSQLMRYMSAIDDLIKYWHKEENGVDEHLRNIKGVRGVLVGANCSDGVKAITRTFGFIEFQEFEITTYIELEEQSYSRIPESLVDELVFYDKKILPQVLKLSPSKKDEVSEDGDLQASAS